MVRYIPIASLPTEFGPIEYQLEVGPVENGRQGVRCICVQFAGNGHYFETDADARAYIRHRCNHSCRAATRAFRNLRHALPSVVKLSGDGFRYTEGRSTTYLWRLNQKAKREGA